MAPKRPLWVFAIGGEISTVMGWARFTKEGNQTSSLVRLGHFEQLPAGLQRAQYNRCMTRNLALVLVVGLLLIAGLAGWAIVNPVQGIAAGPATVTGGLATQVQQ